jgi:hypothetical protein
MRWSAENPAEAWGISAPLWRHRLQRHAPPQGLFVPRSLSEKASVEQPIVAVGSMKSDNNTSLLLRLLSDRHAESDDERSPWETVSALDP